MIRAVSELAQYGALPLGVNPILYGPEDSVLQLDETTFNDTVFCLKGDNCSAFLIEVILSFRETNGYNVLSNNDSRRQTKGSGETFSLYKNKRPFRPGSRKVPGARALCENKKHHRNNLLAVLFRLVRTLSSFRASLQGLNEFQQR